MRPNEKQTTEKLVSQLENSALPKEQKEQRLTRAEVIASLSMERFWKLKLVQMTDLLEEQKIDAHELVRELRFDDYIAPTSAPPMRQFVAINAMLALGVDENTVRQYFGLDAREVHVLAHLNELRFAVPSIDLPKDEIPCLKQALFVYHLPASAVLEYYESYKDTPELLDPVNILDHFYVEMLFPYVITSRDVLSDRQALASYFVTNSYTMESEFVFPYVFRFALQKLQNEENEGKFFVGLDRIFTFRCVASGVLGDDLWLFFEGTRKE